MKKLYNIYIYETVIKSIKTCAEEDEADIQTEN